MWRIRTLTVIAIILVGGVTGVTGELSAEHSVDITGSMDVPSQTVETEWGQATITEVGKEEPGESLEVSTDVPKNESYAIRIVNSEEQNLETKFIDKGGDVERSFLLDRYEPGTYVVALTQNSGDTAVEIEPFIVKGYTIDQSVKDVTEGEPITVDIQLTAVIDDPVDPQAVNVTLFGNGITRSAEATKTGENSYQANFTTDGLSAESYELYTGVETNDDIYGYSELIGLSDSISVAVEEKKTSTPIPTSTPENPTGTDDVGGGSGEKDSETTPAEVEATSTGNTQQSLSTSAVSNQSSATEVTQTETRRQTSESTAVETAPQTDSQPQSTPSNTESPSVTTNSEMPIFSNPGIIVLLGVLLGLLHRLRRSG